MSRCASFVAPVRSLVGTCANSRAASGTATLLKCARNRRVTWSARRPGVARETRTSSCLPSVLESSQCARLQHRHCKTVLRKGRTSKAQCRTTTTRTRRVTQRAKCDGQFRGIRQQQCRGLWPRHQCSGKLRTTLQNLKTTVLLRSLPRKRHSNVQSRSRSKNCLPHRSRRLNTARAIRITSYSVRSEVRVCAPRLGITHRAVTHDEVEVGQCRQVITIRPG